MINISVAHTTDILISLVWKIVVFNSNCDPSCMLMCIYKIFVELCAPSCYDKAHCRIHILFCKKKWHHDLNPSDHFIQLLAMTEPPKADGPPKTELAIQVGRGLGRKFNWPLKYLEFPIKIWRRLVKATHG